MTGREQLVSDIFRSLKKILHRPHLGKKKDLGITPGQWAIVHEIICSKTRSTKELAKKLKLTNSAITQQVNSLVEKGCLMRHEDSEDRRKVIIELSPSFKKKTQGFHDKIIKHFTKMFDCLSTAELKQFSEISKKVSTNLPDNKKI